MKGKPQYTLDITCSSSLCIPSFSSAHLTWRRVELGEEKVIVRHQVFLLLKLVTSEVISSPIPHHTQGTEIRGEWDILPNPSVSEKNRSLLSRGYNLPKPHKGLLGTEFWSHNRTVDRSPIPVHTKPHTLGTVVRLNQADTHSTPAHTHRYMVTVTITYSLHNIHSYTDSCRHPQCRNHTPPKGP